MHNHIIFSLWRATRTWWLHLRFSYKNLQLAYHFFALNAPTLNNVASLECALCYVHPTRPRGKLMYFSTTHNNNFNYSTSTALNKLILRRLIMDMTWVLLLTGGHLYSCVCVLYLAGGWHGVMNVRLWSFEIAPLHLGGQMRLIKRILTREWVE